MIDVWGFSKWAFFFIVIGANPITIYMAQVFINFGGIANFFLGGIVSRAGVAAGLVSSVGLVGVKWLFLWFLYRHKIFFKI